MLANLALYPFRLRRRGRVFRFPPSSQHRNPQYPRGSGKRGSAQKKRRQCIQALTLIDSTSMPSIPKCREQSDTPVSTPLCSLILDQHVALSQVLHENCSFLFSSAVLAARAVTRGLNSRRRRPAEVFPQSQVGLDLGLRIVEGDAGPPYFEDFRHSQWRDGFVGGVGRAV